jgi:hypothetical protein
MAVCFLKLIFSQVLYLRLKQKVYTTKVTHVNLFFLLLQFQICLLHALILIGSLSGRYAELKRLYKTPVFKIHIDIKPLKRGKFRD